MSTIKKEALPKPSFTTILRGISRFLKNLVIPDNVTWPTPKASFRMTGAVFCVSAIFAILLAVMDAIFSLVFRIPFLF